MSDNNSIPQQNTTDSNKEEICTAPWTQHINKENMIVSFQLIKMCDCNKCQANLLKYDKDTPLKFNITSEHYSAFIPSSDKNILRKVKRALTHSDSYGKDYSLITIPNGDEVYVMFAPRTDKESIAISAKNIVLDLAKFGVNQILPDGFKVRYHSKFTGDNADEIDKACGFLLSEDTEDVYRVSDIILHNKTGKISLSGGKTKELQDYNYSPKTIKLERDGVESIVKVHTELLALDTALFNRIKGMILGSQIVFDAFRNYLKGRSIFIPETYETAKGFVDLLYELTNEEIANIIRIEREASIEEKAIYEASTIRYTIVNSEDEIYQQIKNLAQQPDLDIKFGLDADDLTKAIYDAFSDAYGDEYEISMKGCKAYAVIYYERILVLDTNKLPSVIRFLSKKRKKRPIELYPLSN